MIDNEPNIQFSTTNTAVLITNLGTPDAPTTPALRRYLKEFLSDPRVVEKPRWLWWLVLNGVILNIRPSRSAEAYQTVWTEEGSPLLTYTVAQKEKLKQRLQVKYGQELVVDFAMRYGNPSIASTFQRFEENGIERVIVLPLYPQYSGSTSGSTFDAVSAVLQKSRKVPSLHFISEYHEEPAYIEAMALRIEEYWKENGRAELLLFSFHGIPKSYVDKGDPYQKQCLRSAELLAARLGVRECDYRVTFQSRFGPEEWLKPYTDETLKALPGEGFKHVQVFCPGFSADCLETIEEIGEENREYFMESGGETYAYIPALNDSDAHIEAMMQLIERAL
ncbi:ferrochelatase [Algicola sagamiensis]|uniref:ferrochelatase n=1 Tax=Algicola sagamiensis TaxID=163869 RepID=UPI000685F6E1|nr:ferrochelatase [Algicola sagamiensis]